jgi:hypothetical protein
MVFKATVKVNGPGIQTSNISYSVEGDLGVQTCFLFATGVSAFKTR